MSGTRDLILNNPQTEGGENSEMIVTLKANFEKQKAKALSSLPITPHLTENERQDLIESIRQQAIDATDDPPLVTSLSEAFSAAQQKHSAPLEAMRANIDSFSNAGSELSSLVSELSETVRGTKEKLDQADLLERNRRTLLAAAENTKDSVAREKLIADAKASLAEVPDTAGPIKALLERRPTCIEIHNKLKESLSGLTQQFNKDLTQPEAKRLLKVANSTMPLLIADLEKTPSLLNEWKYDEPVPLSRAISSFLTGNDWVTGGEWQDFYGVLPLAVGSLMISIVALIIAIPTGIGAAIYVNQFASSREQGIIKPVIEFIQAIPSVVLGFIGILVFGTVLRDLSLLDSLSWVPGFPIEERLNIFT
ncbi:MAG: hypothetical protein HC845_08390, partial [Akkermansiaceae bacterium]|nr:hypothetical protein [Akkermansiaceae bacterium]